MAESNVLSHQFDDAAQLYDEVRPRYSDEIVEHIIPFAALPAHARIFEVGCGTRQMTLPFAKRGYAVVAVDHGVRLAALAAQHCRPYPRVRVVPCAFEAWQDVPERGHALGGPRPAAPVGIQVRRGGHLHLERRVTGGRQLCHHR